MANAIKLGCDYCDRLAIRCKAAGNSELLISKAALMRRCTRTSRPSTGDSAVFALSGMRRHRAGDTDAARSQPIDDQAFQIFLRLHAYDRTELDRAVELNVINEKIRNAIESEGRVTRIGGLWWRFSPGGASGPGPEADGYARILSCTAARSRSDARRVKSKQTMTDRIGEDPIRRSRQRQCFQEEPNSWYAHPARSSSPRRFGDLSPPGASGASSC